MKKILLILPILLLSVIGWSQKTLSKDYSFNVSAPYKVFDAKSKFYFAKGNEAMSIKFDGDDINIQKFDSDKPAFIKEKRYEKFLPKNYAIESVNEVNGKYIV